MPTAQGGWVYTSEIDAFELYHRAQDGENHFLSVLQQALSGAAGTAFSNVVVYPLDLTETRVQVQHKKGKDSKGKAKGPEQEYTGILDAAAKIYSNEGGVSAFYNGCFDDTVRSVTNSFLFFFAYNGLWRIRSQFPRSKNPAIAFADEISVGALAGLFSKGCTTPIQQIVTRKQTAGSSSRQQSVREIAQEIYDEKGVAGFWAGYSATVILTLNPALTFFLDSFFRRVLRAGDKPGSGVTFLVAAMGKACASTIMYPLSLAKSRAQASTASDTAKGERTALDLLMAPARVLAAMPKVAREEGVGALYAGLPGEVLKGFLSHGLTMLVKERVNSLVISLFFAIVNVLKRRGLGNKLLKTT